MHRDFPTDLSAEAGAGLKGEWRRLENGLSGAAVHDLVLFWSFLFCALWPRWVVRGADKKKKKKKDREEVNKRSFHLKMSVCCRRTPENHRIGWGNKETHHQLSEWICPSMPFIFLGFSFYSLAPTPNQVLIVPLAKPVVLISSLAWTPSLSAALLTGTQTLNKHILMWHQSCHLLNGPSSPLFCSPQLKHNTREVLLICPSGSQLSASLCVHVCVLVPFQRGWGCEGGGRWF